MLFNRIALAVSLVACCFSTLVAQTARLSIDTGMKVADVSPTLYGLMTEEINFSYDGGLYAEMIRNRTFHTRWPRFEHWTVIARGDAQATIDEGKTGPSTALPDSVKIEIAKSSPTSEAGLANPGYWGMTVRPSTTY